MLDKGPLNNPNLSLKAKGLLAYLLSKPPDWRPQVADICARCREKERAVRSALKELQAAGHAVLIKESGSDGRINGSQWAIYEKSNKISPPTEIAVSRVSENSHPNKNKKTNKNERPREEDSLEDFRNYPEREKANRLGWTKEAAIECCLKDFKELLGLKEGSRFWKIWQERIYAAPYRVSTSFLYLEDDIAGSNCGIKEYRTEKVKNPGARANWYYLNLDLDSPPTGTKLKDGCRGKKLSQL